MGNGSLVEPLVEQLCQYLQHYVDPSSKSEQAVAVVGSLVYKAWHEYCVEESLDHQTF